MFESCACSCSDIVQVLFIGRNSLLMKSHVLTLIITHRNMKRTAYMHSILKMFPSNRTVS